MDDMEVTIYVTATTYTDLPKLLDTKPDRAAGVEQCRHFEAAGSGTVI